jgi:hypothetical protein
MTAPDAADRARRRRTLAGALFALALLGIALWVMQAIADRQELERCLARRRSDCGGVEPVPSAGDRRYVPVR